MGKPSQYEAAAGLRQAIQLDKRPAVMIQNFLKSGETEANAIANYIMNYPEVIKVACSKEGRAWLHKWIDDTLTYIQKVAEAGRNGR